jgi:DNA-binding NarL/FixJ family response regulator
MSPVRVVLADDHVLVRAGIRMLLENLDGVSVVAEAADGVEALQRVEATAPDLVVMDIAMPRSNGLDTTAQIKSAFPAVRVMLLSMYVSEEHVLQAMRVGASAYLLKDSAPAELELAVRAVMRGDNYLSPPVSKQVVESYRQRTQASSRPVDLLTPRQREILLMTAKGHPTREIADLLKLSVKTVEAHRAQLMARLDIHDVPGLVRYAIRTGLVTAHA